MFKFRRILVPTDFSEPVNIALDYARDLALDMKAELVILHVIEPVIYPAAPGFPETGVTNYEKELEDASKREMNKLINELSAAGIACRGEILFGSPAAQILDFASHNEVDLICISTHGKTGIEHLLFGSNTEKVLRNAPCPVLAVRAPKK